MFRVRCSIIRHKIGTRGSHYSSRWRNWGRIMNHRTFRSLFVWAFGCLLTGAPAFAQYETAAVLGTVRDATGAVVEKCAVKLQNVSQATASTAATDGAGNF